MTIANATAADPVIRVDGLKKAYGETRAVDGVSFEVRPGTVFGLLGPNGAGKTTTVEVLEGLRTPDSGNVRILGIDVVAHPDELKPRIGVSLQTAALYPKLTVVEVLDLFRGFYRRGRPTNELVELMDLAEKRTTRTQDLSGGQRQRLSVALALVNDPELVFLDEPTTGMDPAARRSLWEIVLGLKAEGRSILLTTHYMEEAEVLCDRIAIMDHGKILEEGTVEDLVSRRFKERAVRFDSIAGLSDDRLTAMPGVSTIKHEDGDVLLYTRDVPATIGAVLAVADELGVEPQNLAVRRATLEDVFLDLTGRALRD
ncbi:MAG TPA: ABC transporter ATP-binding protein [Candidatus Bathyarchaeia archaeon]|jgi:ABC-2 type transport system ATP-binding protein|nr:ABC transporter ATP-binding protein [Candidatus Bathyarchaeia archaeon]